MFIIVTFSLTSFWFQFLSMLPYNNLQKVIIWEVAPTISKIILCHFINLIWKGNQKSASSPTTAEARTISIKILNQQHNTCDGHHWKALEERFSMISHKVLFNLINKVTKYTNLFVSIYIYNIFLKWFTFWSTLKLDYFCKFLPTTFFNKSLSWFSNCHWLSLMDGPLHMTS